MAVEFTDFDFQATADSINLKRKPHVDDDNASSVAALSTVAGSGASSAAGSDVACLDSIRELSAPPPPPADNQRCPCCPQPRTNSKRWCDQHNTGAQSIERQAKKGSTDENPTPEALAYQEIFGSKGVPGQPLLAASIVLTFCMKFPGGKQKHRRTQARGKVALGILL